MFDLKTFLTTQKSHLPIGFDPSHGIKPLFPKGYAGSIGILDKYVFRRTSSSTVQGIGVQVLFGADGAGRWLLAAVVGYSDPDSDSVTISVTFTYPNSTDGCSVEIANLAGSPCWAWVTGIDPWLNQHWPDILTGDCTFNQKIEGALQGGQDTGGDGNVIGEQVLYGVVHALNGGPTNEAGPANIGFQGLPVSAGSDFWYSPYGGGHYQSGTHDPWSDFDYAPLQVSQTNGVGTGIITGTGPDPSTQTGNLGRDVNFPDDSRVVFAVLLNNTEDTVLSVPNPGPSSYDLPSPVLPKTAVGWYTVNTGWLQGTQGAAQFYPSKLGSCPAPALGDTTLVTFNWDNPYWGDNSYSATAPPQYLVTYEGGAGNVAAVIFQIFDG
jgi:hypothetical protein